MLIAALLGGKKELLYRVLGNMLASSGYRVASAVQFRKVNLPKELREFAEAGAGITIAHSVNRMILSTTYVPEDLDGLIKTARCLAPVEPDALILVGFQKLVSRDERIIKALAVWSAKEANSLLPQLAPPVVGVYSDKGDYQGEGSFSDLKDLAKAVIEEGRRLRQLPPSPRRV